MHNNSKWFFHVAFFTCQNVEASEELTWDYGIDSQTSHSPFHHLHAIVIASFVEGANCNKTRFLLSHIKYSHHQL